MNNKGVYKSPYEIYRDSKIWDVVDKAVYELEKNQDIKVTTHRDLVIGFLTKKISLILKMTHNKNSILGGAIPQNRK